MSDARDPSASDSARDLSHDLDRAVDHARGALRRRYGAEARWSARRAAVGLLVVVPAVALAAQLVRWLSGAAPLALPWPMFVALTIAIPLAVVLWRVQRARGRSIARGTALGALDEALQAADRLRTADEFLRRPERSGFMSAALEDARAFARDAAQTELPAAVAPGGGAMRLTLAALGATGLVVIAVWMGTWLVATVRDDDGAAALAQGGAAAPAAAERGWTDERRASPPVTPPPTAATPASLPRTDEEAVADADPSALPTAPKESAGRTRSGRSASAPSSGGASSSRAAPSEPAPSKNRPEPPKDPKTTTAPPKPKPAAEPERKPTQGESGATAGRGASRGSNRNPVVSDWTSRDHVAQPEDEDLEQDEDVEDEADEQEARGGMQPSLRDRRPPVSRDLRIGFGNRKNPDANGRGGPSAPKKSRGTASLVLGVPIPDRVKGQPNPGRTKVTQERVEPTDEPSSALDAQTRHARDLPVGLVHEHDLTPWLREVVRTYFLTVRRSAREKT